jgi:hypothetical protein
MLGSSITENELVQEYFAYTRTYRNAEWLYEYMYERWRNDPKSFANGMRPFIDSRFGIISQLV